MERRVFLAVILSMAVFYAYTAFLAPPPQDPATVSQQAGQPDSTPPAAPAQSEPGPTVAASEPAAAATQTIVGETTEREIVVDTADVQAVITNRGARLLHWRLKNYADSEGKPVDLVPTGLPQSQATPFALKVDDDALTARINNALFRVSGDARVDATTAARTIAFDYQDAAGVRVRKEFTFEPQDFIVKFSTTATQ